MQVPCTVQVVCRLCLRVWFLLFACRHARLWLGSMHSGEGTSALLQVRLEQGDTHKGLISVTTAPGRNR